MPEVKNGDIIIEKETILDRWAKCISEPFEDHTKDYTVVKGNFAGSSIIYDKIISSEATGPDSILVELLKALEDYGTVRLQHYSTKSMSQVQQNLNYIERSVVIIIMMRARN